MRYTLLEMVQLILSSMDSDEVNSISDTVESNQVTLLLKSVFYDLATELGLPEHESLFELDASGDNLQPTLMTVPSEVVRVTSISYNNQITGETYSNYLECMYLPFDKMLELTNPWKDQLTDVGEMAFLNNDETFEIMYMSNKMPQYYTSVDDFTIIFDSYDSAEDTTLQKSKTLCTGSVYPAFTLTNDFEPDLDPDQFSYYINRAKVRAFAELKQAANQEAASETRNQKIRGQRSRRRVPNQNEFERLPKYGRYTSTWSKTRTDWPGD